MQYRGTEVKTFFLEDVKKEKAMLIEHHEIKA